MSQPVGSDIGADGAIDRLNSGLRKANADRVVALIESGRLLAEAENLRNLIARVGAAVVDGRLDPSLDQLAE